MSLIQWLAGSVSLESFRERVLGAQAYAGLGLADDARRLVDWPGVTRLLADRAAQVELVEAGRRRPYVGVADAVALRDLLRSGSGVRVRGVEALDAELGALASSFGADLGGWATISVSAGPAQGGGCGWRRLGSDLFVAQTAGTQDHHFRPNTAHAARSRREPLAEVPPAHACVLEPGDWLYVPRGWWHRAESLEESLSMAIEIARPWPIARAARREPGDMPDVVSLTMKAFEETLPEVVRGWCGEGKYVPSPTGGVDVLLRRPPAPAAYRTPLRLLNPSARRDALGERID